MTKDILGSGGDIGGTAAGIQTAMLGAKTIIVEGTPWLGGMSSAAGVSKNNNQPEAITFFNRSNGKTDHQGHLLMPQSQVMFLEII